MISKIYDKTIKYIKENYKFFIIMIFIIFLFTIPSNYEVYTPGGIIDLKKRIEIKGSSESKGSLNITYVGAKKGTLPILLLSLIIPNWDIESLDENRYENESYKEIFERDRLTLLEVNKYSILVAFKAAKKEYQIVSEDIVVYFVSDEAKTNLKIGDTIVSIEGIEVNDTSNIEQLLKNYKTGDKVNILIKRNNDLKNSYAYITEIDGKKVIGIYLISILEIKTNPEVKFNYKSNESGSSGGLMNALAIYDMLVEEDITKGKKIAGTGTIDKDGNVGEIGGIKYKLAGASREKADIFLVPSDNYMEALDEKNKNNYDIEIIRAETFDKVIEILKNK